MSAQPLAPADAAVRAFRAEHAELHQLWLNHVTRARCDRCLAGRRCRTADDLCTRANTAGWKWQEAERKAQKVGQS